MKYLAQHRKNILNESIVSKSSIETGAIVSFTYINEQKKISKPLVLVLNPHFQNTMHGLKIDEISVPILQRLVTTIRLWYSKRLNELVGMRLPLVKVNVGPPKAFYHRVLKPLLQTQLKDESVYREYKLGKISNLKIIEYNFDVYKKVVKEEQEKRKREMQQLLIQADKLERSKS
jgi:hypothetical protein